MQKGFLLEVSRKKMRLLCSFRYQWEYEICPVDFILSDALNMARGFIIVHYRVLHTGKLSESFSCLSHRFSAESSRPCYKLLTRDMNLCIVCIFLLYHHHALLSRAACAVRNVRLSSVLGFSNKWGLRSCSCGKSCGRQHSVVFTDSQIAFESFEMLKDLFSCWSLNHRPREESWNKGGWYHPLVLIFPHHCKVLICLCPPFKAELCWTAFFTHHLSSFVFTITTLQN